MIEKKKSTKVQQSVEFNVYNSFAILFRLLFMILTFVTKVILIHVSSYYLYLNVHFDMV